MTYAQLLERVNRFGNALRDRLDVRPEERVMLLLLDEPAFAYAFFGAIKIGAVAVPVNTLLKEADYRYLLDDMRAPSCSSSARRSCRKSSTSRAPAMRRLRHVVVVGAVAPHRLAVVRATCSPPSSPTASPSRRAETMRRSGCIRRAAPALPKGCVHLHHDMVVCAELFGKGVLGITATDRSFSVAKLFFAYGLGNALYFPLSVGATTILWPGPPAAASVYDVIERHRPTLFFSVPTGYGMLLAHRRGRSRDFDLSSLRLAVSAGEALPPALFERFKQRFGLEILDGIGSTEALHMFISNRPGAIRPGRADSSLPATRRASSTTIGSRSRPARSATCGSRATRSVPATGTSTRRPSDTIEGEWLRTGDKYTQDADGYFWYAGRSDDMLKVGGQWVSPVEVENALLDAPRCARMRRRRPRGPRRPGQAAGVCRAARRRRGQARARGGARAVRAHPARRLQTAAVGEVRLRAAEDRDRQDSALQAARAREDGQVIRACDKTSAT